MFFTFDMSPIVTESTESFLGLFTKKGPDFILISKIPHLNCAKLTVRFSVNLDINIFHTCLRAMFSFSVTSNMWRIFFRFYQVGEPFVHFFILSSMQCLFSLSVVLVYEAYSFFLCCLVYFSPHYLMYLYFPYFTFHLNAIWCYACYFSLCYILNFVSIFLCATCLMHNIFLHAICCFPFSFSFLPFLYEACS